MNNNKTLKIFISSTIEFFPEHKEFVKDACLRQAMLPLFKENLSAWEENTVKAYSNLLKEADIYVGIFGLKYGDIPSNRSISIPEIEYKLAKKLGIPILVFLSHEEHEFTIAQIDLHEKAIKIDEFRNRLMKNHTVNFFKNAQELRNHLTNSLAASKKNGPIDFHFVSDIPTPPNEYVAHTYTLMQSKEIVGRQNEINLLTEWITAQTERFSKIRVLNIVGIGGQGKSAFTWKWFKEIVPNEMKDSRGRMWWSFYESDATFGNFIIRALSYVKNIPKEQIEKIPIPQREEELLNILNNNSYLLVLDGLERILIAYARLDAAHMHEDSLDEKSENFVLNTLKGSDSVKKHFTGKHRLRKTIDPRAGIFLKKLCQISKSRILITTRLYPVDLQTIVGDEISGCKAFFLEGLTDDDSLNLWRKFDVSGSRKELLPLFNSFENYPLLINSLAGEVANFRYAPKNFGKWCETYPNFNPFELPLDQRKSHVLDFAMRGLHVDHKKVLLIISAFRMPATYETLVALTVGVDKTFKTEHMLDNALTELEDRGLVGWDRRGNRYDLHPVVRGITWHRLGSSGRIIIYRTLHSFFRKIPYLNYERINRIEELTPAIELYNILIGLELFNEAFSIYRIACDAMDKIAANRQKIEMLKALFVDGESNPPKLKDTEDKIFAIENLGSCYNYIGHISQAEFMYSKALTLSIENNLKTRVALNLGFFANLREHKLYSRLIYSQKKLKISNELNEPNWIISSLRSLASVYLACGNNAKAIRLLNKALKVNSGILDDTFIPYGITRDSNNVYDDRYLIAGTSVRTENQSRIYRDLSRATMIFDLNRAKQYANQALNHAMISKDEINIINAILTQGELALIQENWSTAISNFSQSLEKSRKINLLSLETRALIGMATASYNMNNKKKADDFLNDFFWLDKDMISHLNWVDALIIKAKIEVHSNKAEKAIGFLKRAYRLSWCDGPPYYYKKGIDEAGEMIEKMRAKIPDELVPFDKSFYNNLPFVNSIL